MEFSPDIRAQILASMTWQELARFTWEVLNFQMFELEGFPITLGKLLFGLVLLLASYVVSRRIARAFDERVLAPMGIDESLRFTLRRFFFYFLLFITVLMTLQVLHVPLTAFTVIGGALAVGIGFGSQNLVNNFISGLLVMIERPIRVGDYMDIDGLSCRVQSIGIRSTQVRTLSNALVVIPNTTFIEKNLTNWTRSGSIFSRDSFGVAYGTDTAKLKEICLAALVGIDGIQTDPSPGLSFADFGDNALMFNLVYHIHSTFFPSRGAIESEVRYRLNDLFVRHNISIPFPQREIAVRVVEALPVRLES